MYQGNEQFLIKGKANGTCVIDFWRWAYGDFNNNIQRSILAEYIVASAIGSTALPDESRRQMWRPYDLLSPEGWKIEVKCAAHVQEWKSKHPERISYSIAPARVPDETGDYKEDAPQTRNSDCYVFALYNAYSLEENPLELSLWDFYVLKTEILNREKPGQKTISLSSLLGLHPIKCNYAELRTGIQSAMV